MGSEDLHHKRKLRTRSSFERKKGRRDPYDVVLIVCEGEKSEPNYLKGLRSHLKLNPENIKIVGIGEDPLGLVNHALKESKDKDYDRVFCVFDKDQHQRYSSALSKISSCKNKTPIHAINSVPCFEYWLLLHFTDSTSPYQKVGHKSAADQLCDEIRRNYISEYAKGYEDIFNITKDNIYLAIKRAKLNDKLQNKNGTDNPSTRVYQLVEYLISLKNN